MKGDQKLAVQVYAAARLMAEPDNAPEQAYLAGLATALEITPDLTSHVRAALAHPQQP